MSGRSAPAACALFASLSACAEAPLFVPWPSLTPGDRVFLVSTEGERVLEVRGPLDPTSVAPTDGFTSDSSLWLARPDLSALRARAPLLLLPDRQDELRLTPRSGTGCAEGRFDEASGRAAYRLAAETSWWSRSGETGFAPVAAPAFAADLEWSAPAGEAACDLAETRLRPFAREESIFGPSVRIPDGEAPELWRDLWSVSRVDQDRVVAVSLRALFVLDRGEQRTDFDGPRVLLIREMLAASSPDLEWRFTQVLYLARPTPRVIVTAAEFDSQLERVAGAVFAVELREEGFGEVRRLASALATSDLAALGDDGFVAVGLDSIVLGEASGPLRERRPSDVVALTRVLAVPEEERFVLGGGPAYVWTGSRAELLEGRLEPEPILDADGSAGFRSPIRGLARLRAPALGHELWALSFSTGLYQRSARGSWLPARFRLLPSPRDCLGGVDACGLVSKPARARHAFPSPDGGLVILTEICAGLVEWSPRYGCGRRLARDESARRLLFGRSEGRYLTLVGEDGLLLEEERPQLP